jgi:predicted DNA-binding transcriptional regulator AlpA
MSDVIAKTLSEMKGEITSLKILLTQVNTQLQKPQVKPEDELWTVDQVATYLHKSKGTIQSHYQGKPGFPRSKKIGSMRYWKPQEIISYAKKSNAH